MPTAAVIIIGDEILSGKFADENGPFLIRRLGELGCDLGRLVVVGDTVPDIADEVARCAERYDHVLTTGGVGPTHDDRTLEGIAAAFGLPLERRSELVTLLEAFELPLTEANLRMATLPGTAQLVSSLGSSFPVVRVRNVWVFPGIPRLMRTKFDDVAEAFAGERIQRIRLYCRQPEAEIADRLAAVQAELSSVTIGSYPRWGEAEFQVIISLDSRDGSAIIRAVERLRDSFDLLDEAPAVPSTSEEPT